MSIKKAPGYVKLSLFGGKDDGSGESSDREGQTEVLAGYNRGEDEAFSGIFKRMLRALSQYCLPAHFRVSVPEQIPTALHPRTT